jgi:hypothetical protein
VSCPTEALFFAAAPPEPLLLPNFSQALAVEELARARAYGRGLLAVFSEAATKFGQLSRVADFCDEPRLWPGTRCQLL